ncbi:MAG: VWA domain-containing protein, partial [Planctomycetota bacterium]|nr:VWA domain-containing protein [Planctomycetota bacterium]
MSWGLAQTGMLAGLAGVAIPLVIHLLNQRRTTVVDWGAMQFLELGRRARRKFQLSEMLLMAGRMTLLALVALAMTRPFWMPAEAASPAGGSAFDAGLSAVRRDVVLVIDGSGSMSRRAADGESVRDAALRWARRFTESLGPGDSVAILSARDRVTPLLAPASYDLVKARAALDSVPAARGASDLAAAVAESLRLLDVGANPVRDVVVLGDGQAFAWRSDEPSRWQVVRALQREQA